MNSCLCEKSYPDAEYLKSMYPLSILPIYRLVVNASDMMEYEGSLMFDEFPDKERLLRLVDDIVAKIPEEANQGYAKELAMVLTLNEIYHRRVRKREF